MFSRKLLATMLAAPALIAGSLILSAAPAVAAGGIEVRSNFVAVESPNSAGNSRVFVFAKCHSSTRCKGVARLTGQVAGEPTTRTWAYDLAANSSGYMTMYWYGSSPQPTGVGSVGTVSTSVRVNPSGTQATFDKAVTLEKRIYTRKLRGKVTGPDFGSLENVKVTRWTIKGLVSSKAQTADVAADGTYQFAGSFKLGINNASAGDYRLSISATLPDGQFRQWFWRGDPSGNGVAKGGGRWIREAHRVTLNKFGDFQANFTYGKITGIVSGTGSSGAEIRVSAPPVTMPTNSADRRDLDIENCANDFGSDKVSGGSYSVNFLPANGPSDKRYMVKATPSSGEAMALWNNEFGSCQHVRGYSNYSNANLLAVPAGSTLSTGTSFNLRAATVDVPVNMTNSGYTPMKQDRYASLREYTPGKKILDTPVLRASYLNTSLNGSIDNVRPGKYWLEVGRRTSCNGWYKSLYSNNYLYHEGIDRGNERWKTVGGKFAEYQKSYDMGYVAKTPPSGYKGWMYRGFCETRGTGFYKLVTVGTSTNPSTTTGTIKRGATISGRISRIDGKSNKEMLVSVYSTQGVLVMRTAYSGKSGNFKVQGLASGNYAVMVNADSWRGIGRTFRGSHTKRVSAGGSYSVGTLNARF